MKTGEIYSLQCDWDGFNRLQAISGIREWIITLGLDRAQPGSKTANRTFISTIAKGKLPSVSDPRFQWIYFVLRLKWIESSEIQDIKEEFDTVMENFGFPDNITLERYLSSDIKSWCDDEDYECEEVFPNYQNQYVAFTSMWQLMSNGLFKCPEVPYYRNPLTEEIEPFIPDRPDLFREELENFDHDEFERFFGSPFKLKRKKEKKDEEAVAEERILDDSVYSVAWGIHSSRDIWIGSEKHPLWQQEQYGVHIPGSNKKR